MESFGDHANENQYVSSDEGSDEENDEDLTDTDDEEKQTYRRDE